MDANGNAMASAIKSDLIFMGFGCWFVKMDSGAIGNPLNGYRAEEAKNKRGPYCSSAR